MAVPIFFQVIRRTLGEGLTIRTPHLHRERRLTRWAYRLGFLVGMSLAFFLQQRQTVRRADITRTPLWSAI